MRKRVLVCPMDWGLGHATRDAILIEQLIDYGFEVIIGADNAPLLFLRQSFPELSFIVIPSCTIKYSKKRFLMPLKMVLSIPKILRGIYKEHNQLNQIIALNQIDIVISDNRFGLWNKSIYSIFITHQLQILMPGWLKLAEPIIRKINYWFINKYNECWVPDFKSTDNFAGKLSHPAKLPQKAHYIGILSRFNKDFKAIEHPKIGTGFDLLVILSGPEPQRQMLEDLIIRQISVLPFKCLIVKGKPIENSYSQSPKLSIISHLASEYLAWLIINTPVVISRSGYSSIMDFTSLKKHAILIPTPGQTEQEYLAKYMLEKKWFCSFTQKAFNLKEAIDSFKSFNFEEFPDFRWSLNENLAKLM